MAGTAGKIVGALAIVLLSFFVTLYAFDWWSNPSRNVTSTLASNSASVGAGKNQNLLGPSGNFADPKWIRLEIATIVPAVAKTPNGDNSAFELTETAKNSRHLISNSADGITPGAVYTSSVYFQPGNRSIRLEMAALPKGKYGTAACNLDANGRGSVVKAGDVIGGSVEAAGGGWYRCWAAMPYDTPKAVLDIEMRSQAGVPGYQGDGHSGIVIWGAQFERGSRPSAYVPATTGPLAKAH